MDRISRLARDILDKLRGARRPNAKYRQSGIHNPRNNYIGFNNPENLWDRPTITSKIFNRLRLLKVFFLTLALALGSITAFDYYGPNLYKMLSSSRYFSKISSYLKEREEKTRSESNSSQNPAVKQSPSDGWNTKKNEFSSQDVEKAKEQVLRERNRQYWTQEEIDRMVKPGTGRDAASNTPGGNNYFYEIELMSGGRITTEDILMEGGVVEYTNSNGLVVTVKKNEVKTIKRLKATR